MTFEEYLIKKRINRDAFAAEDPARYRAWESMYAQMHPNSFYVAVKMVLNNVRLRYHLREEDVPRPATTAAPRPAARRAGAPASRTEAVPSAAIPEAPVTIPAASDVPQETTEEKPVIPAAAPKPRPVVRRPAALKPPVEGEEITAAKPTEEAAKPAVPRARPVIRRPAALAKPEEQPTSEEQDAKAIPEQTTSSDPSVEAAKPARPRPVIKRPAALQKPSQGEEQPVSEMPAEAIAPAGKTAAEAPKPPHPRPVIKRPSALQKPAEEQQATPGIEDQPAVTEATPAGIESPAQYAAEDLPKPPRPRPVIRRAAALTNPTTSEAKPEETGSVEAAIPSSAADVLPEGKSPASISKSRAPTAEADQAGEKLVENVLEAESDAAPPAKPPRPRPVIKRPAPHAAATPEAEPKVEEQQEGSSPAMANPEEATTEEPPIPESQAEKPKPPRPRPIIRRPPPKTEE